MNRSFVSLLVGLCLTLLFSGGIRAQLAGDVEPAVSLSRWQPTVLVDCPTAGTLPRGTYFAVMRAYPNGGILGRTAIGFSNRFMIGISYGAEAILAESEPNYNPRVEFEIKLSLIDEGLAWPAIAFGFCSQGYGSWDDHLDRYAFKSKGFYAAGSKSYRLLQWTCGVHGGVNYSTETLDDDENLDFFIGFDTYLNDKVGLALEYDFATNDNKDGTTRYGKGNGYLNASIQWIYSSNLVLEVLLKNLTNNRKESNDIWRGLRITYVDHF